MMKHTSPTQEPMNGSVMDTMNIDIAVNNGGDVMILHDKTFEGLTHIEFDASCGDLYFYDADGNATHLGIGVPENAGKKMAKAQNANFLLMNEDHKIAGMTTVPLHQKG